MRIAFVFLVVISLAACGREDTLTPLSGLKIGDTTALRFKNIPLPNERSSFGTYSNSFYFTYDHLDSLGFYRYDFEQDVWESLFLPLDGPNGIKKYDDLVLVNDTLVIHGLKGLASFQLINLKSNQFSTFRFLDTKMGLGKLTSSSIYFDGNTLGFPMSYSKSNKDENYTKEVPIYGFYDITSSKLVSSFGFPEEFHNDIYSLNFLHRDFVVEGAVIHLSMDKSHFIYSYNLNGELTRKTEVRSSCVSVANPGTSGEQSRDMISTMLGGIYSSLLFDGNFFYRNVFYLPEQFKPDDSNNLPMFINALENVKFKVIKLDQNFAKIAEGDFYGAASKKGLGDNLYFVKNGVMYFWLLNKLTEDEEIFVSLN